MGKILEGNRIYYIEAADEAEKKTAIERAIKEKEAQKSKTLTLEQLQKRLENLEIVLGF